MIKRELQAAGQFSIPLLDETPDSVYAQLGFKGHVVVTRQRIVNPVRLGDELVNLSHYTGVVLSRGTRRRFIAGHHITVWLGDGNGKGRVRSTTLNLVDSTFEATINAIRPPSLAAGTTTAAFTDLYSADFFGTVPITELSIVLETYGGEFRVNDDFTLDTGPASELYVTTPTAILSQSGSQVGSELRGIIPTSLRAEQDAKDWISELYILGQGDFAGGGEDFILGQADLTDIGKSNPYKDFFGNADNTGAVVTDPISFVAQANDRAQVLLTQASTVRDAQSISLDSYDLSGTFAQGDTIWVYDPPHLFDPTNPIFHDGKLIHPVGIRVFGISEPLKEGMGVYYRDIDGNWVDLSDFVAWETGSSTLKIGDRNRSPFDLNSSLATTIQQVLTAPPSVISYPDTVIHDTPWTTTSYISPEGQTRAQVVVEWFEPLNTDATTIQDGSHYNIRIKKNTDTIYTYLAVPWGIESYLIQNLDPGQIYNVSIQAQDLAGNKSAYGTDTNFTAQSDTIAPSQPAAPEVAGNPLEIQVTHRLGKNTGGEFNLESDTVKLQVFVDSSGSGFTPEPDPDAGGYNLVGEIPVAFGNLDASVPVIASFQITTTVQRFVKVIAVDAAGNSSIASPAGTVTALLISDQHVSNLSASKIDAGIINTGDITVASKLVVGTGGTIETSDYVAATTGLQITDTGIEVNSGTFRNSVIIGLDGLTDAAGLTVIDGGKITTGTVDADSIVANSIGFAQLVPGGVSDNLVMDPSFSFTTPANNTDYPHDFEGGNGTWRAETSAAVVITGDKGLEYEVDGQTTVARCWFNGPLLYANLEPGVQDDEFYLSIYARRTSTSNTTDPQIAVAEYDENLSFLQTTTFGLTGLTTVQQKFEFRYTVVNVAAAHVRFHIRIPNGNASGVFFYFDYPNIRRVVKGKVVGDLESDTYDGTGNNDGTTGWHLGMDGNIEANNGTFRGTIDAATINGSEIFMPNNIANTPRLVIGDLSVPGRDEAIKWYGTWGSDSQYKLLPHILGDSGQVSSDEWPQVLLHSGEMESGSTPLGKASIQLEGGIIGNDRPPRAIYSVGSVASGTASQIKDGFHEFSIIKSGASSPNTNAFLYMEAPDDDQAHMYLRTDTAGIKFLGNTGEVQVRNGSADSAYAIIRASSFPVGSDARFKTNIIPAESQLATVLSTPISSFEMNGQRHIGIVANDLSDERNRKDQNGYGGWDLPDELARLYKAVQEIAAMMELGRRN